MRLGSEIREFRGIRQIEEDITHLQQIGEILSVEIDLDQGVILGDELIEFCTVHDGIFQLFGAIFIDYEVVDDFTFTQLLNLLFFDLQSIDAIDNIIVQMQSHLRNRDVIYTVGLSRDTDQPMIFSVANGANYFNFLQVFRYLWLSTKSTTEPSIPH